MLKRRHITSSSCDHGNRTALLRWAMIGATLLAMCVVLTLVSHRFGYDVQVIDMPVAGLVTGLVAAGLLFACLARLVTHTEKQNLATQNLVLMIVLQSTLTGGRPSCRRIFKDQPGAYSGECSGRSVRVTVCGMTP